LEIDKGDKLLFVESNNNLILLVDESPFSEHVLQGKGHLLVVLADESALFGINFFQQVVDINLLDSASDLFNEFLVFFLKVIILNLK